MTTGFKRKDLIILAARPMGKTALVMNMAVNAAKRNIPVLIFSLEMDDEQIGDRIVLSEFSPAKRQAKWRSPPHEYQTKLSDEQFMKAQEVFNDLYHLPIRIVTSAVLPALRLGPKPARSRRRCPIWA